MLMEGNSIVRSGSFFKREPRGTIFAVAQTLC
jgi:hypothetical protein